MSKLLDNDMTISHLCLYVCGDVDTGENGTLTYNITSGNGGSEFQINTVNGEDLRIVHTYINKGKRNCHCLHEQLVVTVSDGGTPSLTYDVTVDVNILGVNEFQPSVFVSNPVPVQEDVSFGSVVVSPLITDFDAGTDGQYTAEITFLVEERIVILYESTMSHVSQFSAQSPGSDVFIIDPKNGKLTLRQALDYETVTSYTVSIMDCGTTTHYFVTAYENWIVDDVIQALNCSDAESGTSLIYRIHSGDETKFKVSTDGSVQLKAQIDVDTENTTWPLVIRIVDNGVPQLTSFVNIDVTVEGVDDIQPVWNAPESGTYSCM
ncbi:hypothetical protein KUTeg_021052 [Tegillarca granosa]|uniref:Cadherin domain-containing protein n=1 Tax=Tegillarca granosa TaxID=220873 RepID=A0ABQ9EEY7_TEGGR|nr:hypothetical protein KUTeg_021052 [Tegillarca granosa]